MVQNQSSPSGQTSPTSQTSQTSPGTSKVLSIISYISILWLISYIVNRNQGMNREVDFHVKQGMRLSILSIVAWIAMMVIEAVTGLFGFIGIGIYQAIRFIKNLALFGLMVYGIINAATGQQKRLPIIGDLIPEIDSI